MYPENETYRIWIPRFQNFLWPLARDILLRSQQVLSIQHKLDHSPVTDLDRWSQDRITEFLYQLTPNIPVIAEEDPPHSRHVQHPIYWLVDPIDGTREMIRGSDEFTINIALIMDCQPQFSLMMAPVRSMMWGGIKNGGAWVCDHMGGDRVPMRSQSSMGAMKILVSHSSLSKTLAEILKRQDPDVGIVSVGSALKLCMLAMGQADLLIHPRNTFEWDTASGQLLIEEVGGQVCNLDLTKLYYGKPDYKNNGYVGILNQRGVEYWNKHRLGDIIKKS